MKSERLTLHVIAPDGHSLQVQDVDLVVVRRKEKYFEQGSEVAIFPMHAPLLIRVAIAPLRYQKGERTLHLVIGGGFIEVKDNQVLVVTPRVEEIGQDEPDSSKTATIRAAKWVREQTDAWKEVVGY